MPKKRIDWDKLEKIMRFKPSLIDCAEIMGICVDTLRIKIKDKYDCTFEELRERKMANVRLSLVRKAYSMANKGNTTMMIFCLKNICGWQDSPKDIKEIKEDIQKLTINLQSISDADKKAHGI